MKRASDIARLALFAKLSLFVGWFVASGSLGWCQLTAPQVAVIASADPESRALAEYYLQQRSIPADHLLVLEFPNDQELTSQQWDSTFRPQIQEWLQTRPQIRCLVTVRGVPLSIAAGTAAAPDDWIGFLQTERMSRARKVCDILNKLRVIASDSANPPSPEIPFEPERTLAEWQLEFQSLASAVQKRIQQGGEVSRATYSKAFEEQVTILAGANLLLNSLQQQMQASTSPPPNMQADWNLLRGRVSALQEALNLAQQLPPSWENDTLQMAVIERLGGVLGTLGWLENQLQIAERNETQAAFDSELALVQWQGETYRRHRFQPNFLRGGYADLSFTQKYPTLMTARLDGPSFEVCRQMIDSALAAERRADSTATVVWDGRGLDRKAADANDWDLDQDLARLAEFYQSRPGYRVVWNNQAPLVAKTEIPGPVFLYCGGYSLAKYVDVFEWAPGAIGYHLSTLEASELRNPQATTWCPQMLQAGAAVTIGAVDESGLTALPRPQEFFRGLTEDHLTVGEAFWKSLPFTSWQVILLGDPLYRPFPAGSPE